MAKNVALYARVSSDQQAEVGTIRSQISALLERIQLDQYAVPSMEFQFIDDGHSGANLVRPALERLRDAIYNGAVDRLYVHSPDRLARKYAYQIVLLDEFKKAGIEVIFLNREIGKSPEDELLLQVQGMMAEYERTKIMERARRGKLHAAKSGSVNALARAPYGYRYITKHEGGGEASYEIVFEEARVVQQIFDWVGKERVSISEVRHRLKEAGIKTRTGKTDWDRTTIWFILKNPTYMGKAAFGKTKVVEKAPKLRPSRNASSTRNFSKTRIPGDNWITIPVPALVTEELFAVVQEQVAENRTKARERRTGAVHLLQGLVCCGQCGYAFYGKPARQRYVYYRCIGTDAYRFGGKKVCQATQIRTEVLDDLVWSEVTDLLRNPQRLQTEFARRAGKKKVDVAALETQRKNIQSKVARIIDSYADGLIGKQDFEPRIKRAKEQLKKIDEQLRFVEQEAVDEAQLKLITVRIDDFAAKIGGRLEKIDWDTKRQIIRALVRKVEISHDEVNVVFRVASLPFDLALSEGDNVLNCSSRESSYFGERIRNHCGSQPSWRFAYAQPGRFGDYRAAHKGRQTLGNYGSRSRHCVGFRDL